MPALTISLTVPVIRSARVKQIEAMFDVPAAAQAQRTWHAELPLDEREWSVGLIVGPSGSGKSTIAAHLWPQVQLSHHWDADKAIIDCFPQQMPTQDVAALLTSVGLGTAPSWLKPHRVLSTGEQFRANVARSLASDDDPVVIDEFTSVVDRQVGQVASHAVQKAVRRRGQRFVAVTCHEDVEPWLNPDWVLRTDSLDFSWRSKQRRPEIQLCVAPISPKAWQVFSKYHYLTASLPGGHLQSWGGWVGDRCVAFAYVCKFPHPKAKDIVRARRHVVLPDWQGLGIGSAMEDWIAAYYTAQGYRFRSVIAHPGMIAHYMASPKWRYVSHHPQRLQVGKRSGQRAHHLDPRMMQLRTFQYVGGG